MSSFSPGFSLYFTKDYDPELQGLLTAQSTELDPAKRNAQTAEIQQIIVEKGYAFPATEGSQTQAAGPKIHGLSFQAPWWPSYVDAWIEN